MMIGLSLTGRLIAILLMLLIALGLAGIGLSWWTRGIDTGGHARVALPDQVAAIVELLERNGSDRREMILRSVNSDELKVSVSARRPPATEGRRMPVAEWLVANYLEAMPSRDVEVMIQFEQASGFPVSTWIKGVSPGVGLPLRIVVPLTTGEYATFTTHGTPGQRVFGLPTGFWVGVLGAILGGMAILAIRREARPLSELSHAVGKFAVDARPAPVAPQGAPEIRSLIASVNAMQTRIAALVKGRSILLGAVSHDLKTYITRLRLRVEAIDDEPARLKAVRDLDEMTALIDSAIAVARGEAAAELREAIDILPLIGDEIASRDSGRLTLIRSPTVVEATVTGDSIGLKRLFGNILDNALHHAARAEIAVGRKKGRIEVIVDDDGPGIPADEREAVFEPFYRAEPSRSRATGGSGLGLAIARQIVEAHGGTIWAAASPLGGARISIALPAARQA